MHLLNHLCYSVERLIIRIKIYFIALICRIVAINTFYVVAFWWYLSIRSSPIFLPFTLFNCLNIFLLFWLLIIIIIITFAHHILISKNFWLIFTISWLWSVLKKSYGPNKYIFKGIMCKNLWIPLIKKCFINISSIIFLKLNILKYIRSKRLICPCPKAVDIWNLRKI